MSSIVLSAAVRQNLLSLQSTAQLLSTTQNRLATGKKVNSALDNPTNFFTAQGLDARASDINNLLDGISNGVQVLQAANTGITSIQKLVDTAKATANQALQTATGYSAKSSFTSAAITGATASNLLGSVTPFTSAAFTGTAATGSSRSAYAVANSTGTVALTDAGNSNAAATGTTTLDNLSAIPADGSTLVVNGTTITFSSAATATTGAGTSSVTVGTGTGTTSTLSDVLTAIQAAAGAGAAASVDGTGNITLTTGTASDITISGTAATTLGIATLNRGGNTATTPALTGATLLSGTAQAGGGNEVLSTGFQANDTITVNGQTLTFVASGATGANQINVTDDVTTLLGKIDGLSGGTGSSIASGVITLNTGTTSDLTITSSRSAALTALGLGTGVTQARGGGTSPLSGLTLTVGATGGGTATNITFGTGTGQISTLNQLNTALAANNLSASISTAGAITIATTNDAASSTIGTIGGTAFSTTGAAFASSTVSAPVADATSQSQRAALVRSFNDTISQIDRLAADASFNGVNLLSRDDLKLVFNETGRSTATITGVDFTSTGLGLNQLTSGTDFLDAANINANIAKLNTATSTLRSQASTFGSSLSLVQIRQDFSKNLINVLQTGSANLTLADTNEEAANSQALTTRQQLSISALSLANQAQQSVLQLLR